MRSLACVVGLESNTPGRNSRLVSFHRMKRLEKVKKTGPVFGKVAGNLGKSWVSFWEATDKLGKKSWFSCEKFSDPASYDPLDLALSSPSWLHIFPPGLPTPSNGPPVLV